VNPPQHIHYGVATTVAIDVPTRPTASTGTQTVSCYDDGGGAVFSDKTATASTISTTLSAAAAAKAETVTLTAVTGVAAGLEFWLRSPDEKVLCRSVDTGTKIVTLARPLYSAHASGAVAEGTRLTYSVSTTDAASEWWDGRLVWTVDAALATKRVYVQACCCSAYPFSTDMATEQDLLDVDANFFSKIDSEHVPQRLILLGAQEVITRLSAMTEGRAFTFIGTTSFTRAVVYAAFWYFYAPQAGNEAQRLYDRFDGLLEKELARVVAGLAYRDADGDGAVEQREQVSYASRRIYRA